MWYSNDMFRYVFIAEFAIARRFKSPVGIFLPFLLHSKFLQKKLIIV